MPFTLAQLYLMRRTCLLFGMYVRTDVRASMVRNQYVQLEVRIQDEARNQDGLPTTSSEWQSNLSKSAGNRIKKHTVRPLFCSNPTESHPSK